MVREFAGAWLSACGRRAIWTASGPWGQLRSSAGPAAPGLAAGVLAETLPAGAGGLLVQGRQLPLHLPRTRPGRLHSGPQGRQGNFPGDGGCES